MPPRPSSSAKAAILSALATFDSDSDERDDTYDATDVGGTVDTALPGTSDDIDPDQYDGSSTEEALFRAFQKSPAAFDRDAGTRRGPMRAALKDETGMTDEAIEGWAIMLKRNPWRLQKLETRFSTSAGGQREIPSSAYRQNGPDSATEDSDVEGPEDVERVRSRVGSGPGRGHSLARGRGRGRGGRVDGEVSNPADKQATQLARQRKDAHKGSRANHNRRDQRARKMARGGGMAG
jgi:activating signal cointegrator complex subunit 2